MIRNGGYKAELIKTLPINNLNQKILLVKTGTDDGLLVGDFEKIYCFQ